MLKVFEAFAGYGSQAMALKRLAHDYPEFEYEVVGISEIEKTALQAYEAIHGHCPNYGDISNINWREVPDFDLFTYSFPCTDISNAGEQAGLTEGSGTRSSLLWECRKAIEIKRPKYLLMENVPALVGKKFLPQLNKWQAELESYGYTNFTKTLNAKDFGTPQNRNRVFMVSILGDANFEFPQPFELTCRLKDVLDDVVDEKYYISDEKMQAMLTGEGGCKFNKRLQEMLLNNMIPNADGIYIDTYNKITNPDVCGTIKTTIDSANMTYTTVLKVGNYSPSGHNASSVVSPDGIAPTVMENHGTVTAVIVDDTYANREPRIYPEYSPTIRSERSGLKVIEPKVMQVGNIYPDTENYKNRTMGRIYSADGISPTINCCGGGDREPKILECEFFGFGRSRDKKGNIVSRHFNDYVNCIHAQVGSPRDNMQVLVAQLFPFRIRKLTPKECFRLMDVTDEDIAKVQNTGISNSKQYKLAGNSICVNVLYFIMEQMFCLKDIKGNRQLTLF
jgi:DNA (cytosine-5)-methyltransferase 1